MKRAFFVDGKSELEELEKLVRSKVNVLLYGLRGIGKTTLLEKLSDELSGKYEILFIRGYEVTSLYDVREILGTSLDDPKALLSELLSRDEEVRREAIFRSSAAR